MIGRFCGQEFPYENKNIVSSHNSLYFWFHSDNSVSYDGFAFEWNSVKPICGGSLTNDYGTISSPGSPGRYPPNRDCYWQITVKSGKRIQIHFGQLMLEEHRTCGADFLEASVYLSFNPSNRRTEDIYACVFELCRSALYTGNDWDFTAITRIQLLSSYPLPASWSISTLTVLAKTQASKFTIPPSKVKTKASLSLPVL